MTTTKSNELAKQLSEKGVRVGDLLVAYCGSEQLIGECHEMDKYEELILLRKPKRILRLQQVQADGVAITLMIGDFDFLVGEGLVYAKPTAYYNVLDQSEETKEAIYETYLQYFKRKSENRAVEAGLIVPKTGIGSPFRK